MKLLRIVFERLNIPSKRLEDKGVPEKQIELINDLNYVFFLCGVNYISSVMKLLDASPALLKVAAEKFKEDSDKEIELLRGKHQTEPVHGEGFVMHTGFKL